jgi:hypothetical protein
MSRRMSWDRHVARRGMRCVYNILAGKFEGKRYVGRLGVSGRLI